MNDANPLPPYLALPQPLRDRIRHRLEQAGLIVEDTAEAREVCKRQLACLGAFRLVRDFEGDIRAARAYSKKHSQQDYPSCVIGSKKADWEAAIEECEKVLRGRINDEKALREAAIMVQEIGLWELEHGAL
jgi:hypothetical protein